MDLLLTLRPSKKIIQGFILLNQGSLTFNKNGYLIINNDGKDVLMSSDITQMTVLELKALRKKIDKQIRVAERAELKQKELDQKRKERENLALLKQKAKN